MKRIIFLSLFTILSTTAFAQIRVGLKINLSGNNLFLNPDTSAVTLEMIRPNGGIIASYKFTKFFSLQSELIYARHGKNYVVESAPYFNLYGDKITNRTNIKIRLEYLEIPLSAKFTFFGNQKVTFDVSAGFFVGCLLSARQQTNDEPFQNTSANYTAFNAGYNSSIGLSVMKQRLFFEMGGSRGLVNINMYDDTKMHTMQTYYGVVGFYLFQGKKK